MQLHPHFVSIFILDTLNSLGFCSSYSEVQRLESCASVSYGTDIPDLHTVSVAHTVQYIADNVDHNDCMLYGHDVSPFMVLT